eukprot:TRINITY_DN12548_c1_g1_i3.p1 TRINITY_DN12548_c1_g1~~TRINITY_DN12548_c1_g1_i3.p1  ORF type:complete len:984 (-),score=213.49 TRINITY_DN12548_c1_g1_i3:98-3049(-)
MDASTPITPSASSSAPPRGGGRHDAPDLVKLPRRFFDTSDVVAQEIADLPYPWNQAVMEERIRDYSSCSEAINVRLSDGVRRNYSEFVQGMQQVESVETELTMIGVLLKNSRRKLKERDTGLRRGSLQVARQHRKRDRLRRLLATLTDFQAITCLEAKLREGVQSENYVEALAHHAALREDLAAAKFRQFPGILSLRQGLGLHLAVVQQKLSDGLRVAAVSQHFDAERYEEILQAYSMISTDQALSVGKEILRHVSECIVAVSRQCMLAFSAAPSHESPSVWHQKVQLKDLCRSMDPTRFVACTAQLYECLCDFLYRHQFLCAWHVSRLQINDEEEVAARAPRFREVLREVLSELGANKRVVWDRIQQQVSLVLMTCDFQYPGLSEDGFLHILHLTQLLIDEGDSFMVDFQSGGGAVPLHEGRRQWSAPIRNTLKTKAHDYFHSLHYHVWVSFKVAYIDQDNWQRLPVPRTHRLLRPEKLRAPLPTRTGAGQEHKPWTAENNPFRNYKADPLLPAASSSVDATADKARDELDEHALLQHWIEDSEAISLEQIGSSLLSNSNRSPVVSSSTVELSRMLERYVRMMGATPQLALDIFQAAVQLVEFYVHSVLCLFVQEKHLRVLLEEVDMSQPLQPGDPRLYQRHEALLLQRLCPDLRKVMIRFREHVCSLDLPDNCAASLNLQAPASGAVLLQVAASSKLSSPASLCGLVERCVGADSVASLMVDLKESQEFLGTLLPRGVGQEALERFLPAHEVIVAQLRTFVLSAAARDLLEIPDVGRVSLDQFSATVQAQRWDGKDFSQGSPAAPFLEQMRAQIDELARRLPCAGGGSIPHATQRCIWGWMEVRLIHECAELVSRLGRKKSQEALFVISEDFQTLRKAVGHHFQSQEDEEDVDLLPPDHPLVAIVAWSYLDHYVQAHGGVANEAIVWCKRHPEYPMRLHKALLDYLHGSQKPQKQFLVELETFYATYIADEAACSSPAAGM